MNRAVIVDGTGIILDASVELPQRFDRPIGRGEILVVGGRGYRIVEIIHDLEAANSYYVLRHTVINGLEQA